MNYWLKTPLTPVVAQYVANYWLIERPPHTISHDHPKLNPDPSAHLILTPQNQPYHYETSPRIGHGTGSHLLFPHQETLQLDHANSFILLGIKFHIGAIYSLDMRQFTHPQLDAVKQTSLSTLLNIDEKSGEREAFNEQHLIGTARRDSDQCCRQLDELLLPWLVRSKEDKHSQLTRKALTFIDDTPISALSEQLYCSQRTLERSFHRVTGLTLKQCQSMKKLEAMLEYLYQRDSSEIDWAEVAYRFGFSDQPHLIRHLKKQIGLTPKKYAKERGLTIDVYGGVKAD